MCLLNRSKNASRFFKRSTGMLRLVGAVYICLHLTHAQTFDRGGAFFTRKLARQAIHGNFTETETKDDWD